jgi:hypothetical protein
MNRPGHLIHIGYPKTGSNFLRRWFKAHPQLAYAEGGIAGYRDVYEIARQAADPNPGVLYRVTSCESLSTPHPYVGSAEIDYEQLARSPMGPAQAQVSETLGALFPNAKILVVTRGFRSAMLSKYSQYVRTGGEDDLLTMAGRVYGPAGLEHDPWNYDTVVALFRAAFGENSVMIMPYELLRDDATGFVKILSAKLGIDSLPPSAERLNPAVSAVELAWFPPITRFVRRAPLGPFRRRFVSLYLRALFNDRLSHMVRLMQSVRPRLPVDGTDIPDSIFEPCRGRNLCLRGNPLFAPYARDYLID